MITRKYYLFDANDKTPGRMATEIARILRGKNKVDFTPHIDGGDFVVVINSDNIKISCGKGNKKIYYRFSGYPGGITAMKLKDQMIKDSRKVIHDAVYGMLCKNKLRDKMMKRLLIYTDENHKHTINGTTK
ncbi:MAG TPA: 50S ribosomal protein L13 [Candidatus Moranbacteria bacterium]|nr:50S ribosomal protein L13 [Candidatus Moranbacteria bacterium]HAT74541.1 50S ribosomal protein L13 [Candidatus Moranbacteria bacterium]